MVLKADYEFLFVGRDDNSFLENYSYDLFEQYGENSGEIFINIEIQNNPVDSEEIAAAIFETMQKVFFENMAENPYSRFEIALKAVNNILAQFKSQKSSGYIGNLNIIIAAIIGEDLYIAQSGDAEAYLIRKRYVGVITEGLDEAAEDNNDVFVSIASGKIEEGDTVLFSTTRLLRYISKTDLAQIIDRRSVAQSLENLKDTISTEILGKIGLTAITFSKAAKGDVEDIENEVDGATKTILQSSMNEVVSAKEKIAGKFWSKIKNYRNERPQIFQKRAGVMGKISDWSSGFMDGLFSKGFGKDKILAFLVLVIVVLTLGVFWATGNQAERAEIERLDEVLQSVQNKVAEADTKASYDKEASKELLDQAYLEAKSVLDSGYYREKATLFLIQIEETRDKLDAVKRIKDPAVLADLSKKRSDVNALGFVSLGDRIFIYEHDALYELVLDQVQDPLTLDDKETVVAATGFDDRESLVFLTQSGKLIEYKDGTTSYMDTEDGAFHKGVAIDDWSNRIYILDPNANDIWRYDYRGTRDSFGSGEAYLNDKELDLSKAVDLAIDASVYVLLGNGDLMKFYAGKKADFTIDNPPLNLFKTPSKVYTDEKLDEVYVIDSQEARILVFQKNNQTGNVTYKAQYLLDEVGALKDIYVDADSGKALILTSNKVLELELN